MSVNSKISETAFAALLLRALSNYENSGKVKTNDFLAEAFLPEDRIAVLSDRNMREDLKKQIPKGLYEYVIARTNYFDNVFIEGLKNKINQIVILGAGYDSRSYRFNKLIGQTRIFELDSRPTQEHKISVLERNKISVHENIAFIAMDFEADDFSETLRKNNFDESLKTLFIWEGVTFYLTEKTVVSMMKTMRDISGGGSELVFDFQTIFDESDLVETGVKNEQIRFGIKNGEIVNFVVKNGFKIIEHLRSEDMEKKFLMLENGNILGSISPIMNFLRVGHD